LLSIEVLPGMLETRFVRYLQNRYGLGLEAGHFQRCKSAESIDLMGGVIARICLLRRRAAICREVSYVVEDETAACEGLSLLAG
jgi:hypothetical protein